MAGAQDAGMGEIRRRLIFPVAVLAACGSLSACYMGPDPVQYGALAVIDGKATAVVALCGRSTSRLTVYQDDNDPAAHDFVSWSTKIAVPEPADDVEVVLLDAARTEPSNGGPERPLTSFEPGHHYTLDASKGGPEGTSAPTVGFTTDDLTRIGKGQVLAPIDYKKADVVARESFVKTACAKKGPGA
jgi:hypothetical protein